MEAGEEGGGGGTGKIKEIFKPARGVSEEDLLDSSETRLLHDAQVQEHQGHSPSSTRNLSEKSQLDGWQ